MIYEGQYWQILFLPFLIEGIYRYDLKAKSRLARQFLVQPELRSHIPPAFLQCSVWSVSVSPSGVPVLVDADILQWLRRDWKLERELRGWRQASGGTHTSYGGYAESVRQSSVLSVLSLPLNMTQTSSSPLNMTNSDNLVYVPVTGHSTSYSPSSNSTSSFECDNSFERTETVNSDIQV